MGFVASISAQSCTIPFELPVRVPALHEESIAVDTLDPRFGLALTHGKFDTSMSTEVYLVRS